MGKRLTDTEKWNKNWFSNLDSKGKLIWLYICDNCDHSGIFEINEKLMSFHLGFKVTEKGINTLLIGKLYPIGDSKYFLPSFIEFQYGELSEECRPHKPVIKRLNDYGLIEILNNPERVLIGYSKGINTLKEKEQEQYNNSSNNITTGEDSNSDDNDNNNNSNLKVKRSNNFSKPTIEEIKAYCKERNNTIDAATFYDHYESKKDEKTGKWMIGNRPMADWKAAVRTWESKTRGATYATKTGTDYNKDVPEGKYEGFGRKI